MNCSCNNIDKATIDNAARQLLLQSLAELVQSIPCKHTNGDGNYSPSQYWVDKEMTMRRAVSSSMNLSLDGTTIKINLQFGSIVIEE